MARQLLMRLGRSILALVGLLILVFVLARLTGDPSTHYLPIDSTAALRAEYRTAHGFDDPIVVQLVRFLAQVVRLDLGSSIRYGQPAVEMVLKAFPTTFLLAVLTMAIAIVFAVVVGALSAWRPGGPFDRMTSILSLLGASVPNFWIAIVGILVFSVSLRLLPTSGTGSAWHWVLPVAVLALRPCGLIAQVLRNSMITALSSQYVRTARSKGLLPWRIIFVHALRNALLPTVTVAGDQAVGLISGAVIVEVVFGLPGIGKLLVDSIAYRDFAVIQAAIMFTAIAIFILNMLIDALYALLDPRVRIQ